jgi:hypothetical protein
MAAKKPLPDRVQLKGLDSLLVLIRSRPDRYLMFL